MRRSLIIATMILLPLFTAASARGAVEQTRDSMHHEIKSGHDLNICGQPGTFTFDVTSHTHTIDTGTTFKFDYTEAVKYTLVFDDPALGTWTAHNAETIHFVENRSVSVFSQNFNGREGPIQIIEHRQFHTDADGNVTVDRTFERHVGC
jgi:hypothetical protein